MIWLVGLFVPPPHAEAIVGDLCEERSVIAARDGESRARRWYRRQVARTIVHLAVSPLREAPLRFAGLGFLGLGLAMLLSRPANWLASSIAVRVHVYEYVPATWFWHATATAPFVVVGVVAALTLGRRAMGAALAVVGAILVWAAVINPVALLFVLPPEHMPGVGAYLARLLGTIATWVVAVPVGTVAGIAVRRRSRSPATRAQAY